MDWGGQFKSTKYVPVNNSGPTLCWLHLIIINVFFFFLGNQSIFVWLGRALDINPCINWFLPYCFPILNHKIYLFFSNCSEIFWGKNLIHLYQNASFFYSKCFLTFVSGKTVRSMIKIIVHPDGYTSIMVSRDFCRPFRNRDIVFP